MASVCELSGGPPVLGLFDPPALAGLVYRENYVDEALEAALMADSDARSWSLELGRRRQWYGGDYDDTELGLVLAQAYRAFAPPDRFGELAERLCADGILPCVATRFGVNEYQPGQGIGAHMDRDNEVVASVAILSLGAGLMMDFVRPADKARQDVRSYYLRRRSLLLIAGEARYQWMHGIAPRRSDKICGLIRPRGRRLSIMFRCRPES
ncbi:alpha-ketoglutarate-dependent dioxygenase AlkB [Asticcacaulis sp. ZE23SCel15]|uniref:alpha-ketoglutarate-dependent dioxygenase AlkB n=1 Tax=Asticcacaulis sp. ZE23SCel15 TaxID=3059027 RepID=UPI00265E6374|nr:alpha-ketoglutarate-dependent dioxygenase AlkB [Asticcacaulis sp. ZE23SCel15]WKL57582.1 alpha-ketoglutarate-dependent dioxygenase AlkB [Asticcacaulis sp. ZE23SCel15]